MEAKFQNGSKMRNILKPFKAVVGKVDFHFSENGLQIKATYTTENKFDMHIDLQLSPDYFMSYTCDKNISFETKVPDLIKKIADSMKQQVSIVARENEDYLELLIGTDEQALERYFIARNTVGSQSQTKMEFKITNAASMYSKDFVRVIPILSDIDKEITLRSGHDSRDCFEFCSLRQDDLKSVTLVVPLKNSIPGVTVLLPNELNDTVLASYLKVAASGHHLSPNVNLKFPNLDDKAQSCKLMVEYKIENATVPRTLMSKDEILGLKPEKKPKLQMEQGSLRFFLVPKVFAIYDDFVDRE